MSGASHEAPLILYHSYFRLCDGERACRGTLRGLAVRIDIRGGARHGDDVTDHKAVTLYVQARLIIDERVNVEIERRTVRDVPACGMVRRDLVRRRVRCHLYGGAGWLDSGDEFGCELYKVTRLDGARLRRRW